MCASYMPVFPRDVARVAAACVSDTQGSHVLALSVMSVCFMTNYSWCLFSWVCTHSNCSTIGISGILFVVQH